MECIYCKIVANEAPADIVYEDELVMAFISKHQVSEGHTLVVPKNHFENLFDIPEEQVAALGVAAKIVATKLRDEHGATGVNLLHASGKDAQQSVFHFHLHVVPRYPDDGLDMWIKQGL